MSGVLKVQDVKVTMPVVVFRSKYYSGEVLQLLAVPALLSLLGVVLVLLDQHTREIGVGLLVLGLLIGAVSLLCHFPRRYTLGPDNLVIQTGLFRKTIPLARIRSALLTGDPEDSDSVRNVRLTLDSGKRIIYPQQRTEFIRVLKERAYL